MKSGIIFYVLVLFCLMPGIVKGQYRFEIKGYINNGSDKSKRRIVSGDKIVLRFYNLQQSDTTTVNDSGFVIQGEVPYPSIAMLEYKHGGDLFLLDNSSYSYYLDLKLLDSTHREYESTIKTNSPFYTTWDNFQNKKADLYKKKEVLLNQLETIKNPDSILYINTAVKEIDNQISRAYKQLAIDNANMYATAYIVPASPGFSYADYVDIYNSLPDSIKNTFYGKNFHDKLMTSKQVEGKDLGSTISWGRFRQS